MHCCALGWLPANNTRAHSHSLTHTHTHTSRPPLLATSRGRRCGTGQPSVPIGRERPCCAPVCLLLLLLAAAPPPPPPPPPPPQWPHTRTHSGRLSAVTHSFGHSGPAGRLFQARAKEPNWQRELDSGAVARWRARPPAAAPSGSRPPPMVDRQTLSHARKRNAVILRVSAPPHHHSAGRPLHLVSGGGGGGDAGE